MPSARWSRALAAASLLGVATFARPGGTQPPAPSATARVDAAPIDDAIQKLAADVQRWGGALGVHVVDVDTRAA